MLNVLQTQKVNVAGEPTSKSSSLALNSLLACGFVHQGA